MSKITIFILMIFVQRSFGLSSSFKNEYKDHLSELEHINSSDDYLLSRLRDKVSISIKETDSGWITSDTVQIEVKAKAGFYGTLYTCEIHKADLDLKRECGVWKLNDCTFISSPANRSAYAELTTHFGEVKKLTNRRSYFYYISNLSKLNGCKSAISPSSIFDNSRSNEWKPTSAPGSSTYKPSSVRGE